MTTKKPAARTTKAASPKASATPAPVTAAQAVPAAGAPRLAAVPAAAPVQPADEPIAVTVREPVLKKKELIERVVEASGMKRKDVKPIVESTLKVLGDALSAGAGLVLPPFGKAKINRQKDLASGEMMIIKLRRDGPAYEASRDADEDLAKDDD
ncbi:MAG: HU family DNA-binding protein [Paracoccaceae bacterium]